MRKLSLAASAPALLFLTSLTLAASICSAARIDDVRSSVASSAWYMRHAEGWHWYKDPLPEEEEEPLVPLTEPPTEETEPPEPAAPLLTPALVQATSPAQPVAFSQEWLKNMIPVYLNHAVDNPTPENVEAFYVLQRIAMDKAEKFARVAEQVRVGNRLIDETFRRPVSSFGLQDVDREADKRTDELLKKVSSFAGIFFFFKEGCPFCERQAPLIKELERKGFNVMAVSIDGGALRSAQFDHVVRDEGQAALLNVQATPALFLANPSTNTIALLGEGLMSLPELARRILLVSARNKWISEEELKQIRHDIDPNASVDLSAELPKIVEALKEAEKSPQKFADVLAMLEGRDAAVERARLTEMPSDQKRALMDENGFIDPKTLLSVMHGLYADRPGPRAAEVPASALSFALSAPSSSQAPEGALTD